MKSILKFFDKLEDRTRMRLSRYPVTYAFIGGVAIVLFWRGVEHTANLFSFMTGPVSLIISIIILLATGLFVSFFVGEDIILTGLKHEKKLAEKTEAEIETEQVDLYEIREELRSLKNDIREIKTILADKNRPEQITNNK